MLLALTREPTDADRADAHRLAAELDRAFPQIDGAGVIMHSAERLPRYRPTSLLARETNGDIAQSLERVRARWSGADAASRMRLSRSFARKVVRTGFSLVMPRWNGWTSDLVQAADVFAAYYPQRAHQMGTAADAARRGDPDPGVMVMLLDDLGPWLAAEYAQVHGLKGSGGR